MGIPYNCRERKVKRQKSALARLNKDIEKYKKANDNVGKLDKAIECAANLTRKLGGF